MQALRDLYHLGRWNLGGQPVPPPHIFKQRTIANHQKRFGIRILVETGTYRGEMVKAMLTRFEEIYSIELSPELCARAKEMFAAHKHVHILEGDSAAVLPNILAEVNEPCLFWLDGHFSGGVTAQADVDYPILEELDCIARRGTKDNVILIDDARLFVDSPNAPSEAEVYERLKRIDPEYIIEERHDIIRAFVK